MLEKKLLLAKYLPYQKPYQTCQMFHTGLHLFTINGKGYFFIQRESLMDQLEIR